MEVLFQVNKIQSGIKKLVKKKKTKTLRLTQNKNND